MFWVFSFFKQKNGWKMEKNGNGKTQIKMIKGRVSMKSYKTFIIIYEFLYFFSDLIHIILSFF